MRISNIYEIPAPDAPAEEWGRLAVSLPGWRWTPGMLVVDTSSNPAYRFTGRAWDEGGVVSDDGDGINLECICAVEWPDPDDPATAGCLWEMAGRPTVSKIGYRIAVGAPPHWVEVPWHQLGRACIEYAAALGRWPGGEG